MGQQAITRVVECYTLLSKGLDHAMPYVLPLPPSSPRWCLISLSQSKVGSTRTVQHFYYLGWPDFGVPDSPTGVLTMLQHVRALQRSGDPDVPTITHCR